MNWTLAREDAMRQRSVKKTTFGKRGGLAMFVPPLPIICLLALARLFPFVILDMALFQITMPSLILAIVPLVLHFVILSLQDRRNG
jgi:Flp pilus assembly protein TadB